MIRNERREMINERGIEREKGHGKGCESACKS